MDSNLQEAKEIKNPGKDSFHKASWRANSTWDCRDRQEHHPTKQ